MARKTAAGTSEVLEKSWDAEIEKAEAADDFEFPDTIDEEFNEVEEEPLTEERNGQGILPGTKYANPEIVVAARDYADKRDARMDWQRQEKKAMEFLTALMDKKQIEELHDGDVHITAERTRKFKVKIGNGDDSDE